MKKKLLVLILTIFLISNVYAQSHSENNFISGFWGSVTNFVNEIHKMVFSKPAPEPPKIKNVEQSEFISVQKTPENVAVVGSTNSISAERKEFDFLFEMIKKSIVLQEDDWEFLNARFGDQYYAKVNVLFPDGTKQAVYVQKNFEELIISTEETITEETDVEISIHFEALKKFVVRDVSVSIPEFFSLILTEVRVPITFIPTLLDLQNLPSIKNRRLVLVE